MAIRSRGATTCAPLPIVSSTGPGSSAPPASAAAGGSAASPTPRGVGRVPRWAGARSRALPAYLHRLSDRRQKIDPEVELVDDVFGPVVAGEVVEQRGGGIARRRCRLRGAREPAP